MAYRKVFREQWDSPGVRIAIGLIIEAAAVAAIADVLGQPVERQVVGPTTIAAERPGIRPVLGRTPPCPRRGPHS